MRYRRWSRITTNDFVNDRRKRKSLGRSGGMLPREIFRILTPYTPFSLGSESFRQDIGQLLLLARMNPCKSADYFIKVNFRIAVDMKQGESKPFSVFKIVLAH